MNPKTELLLYHLFWTAGAIARPTFRNLDDSFESWAYRNGFIRRVRKLEAEQLLESERCEEEKTRAYRLSEAGRLQALGGRDPEFYWNRPWDGVWRMVIFDLPERDRVLRNRLTRRLRHLHFGSLQQSVWITPHPVDELSALLNDASAAPASLMVLEGRPCSGESPADVVRSAWDFNRINAAYRVLDSHLDRCPLTSGAISRDRMKRWAARELQLWKSCVLVDPLLPVTLLPAGYAGQATWKKRCKTMGEAGKWMAKS